MIQLKNSDFDSAVASGKVLVDFWASWCGPCKMIAPVLEKLSAEYDNVKFCKVNVDEEPALAIKFKVESIPTLLLFEDGKLTKKLIGFRSEDAIKEFIG